MDRIGYTGIYHQGIYHKLFGLFLSPFKLLPTKFQNRIKNLFNLLFGSILTYGFYQFDITSDLLQAFNLFWNCHKIYGFLTLTCILVSYLFTVILLMYYRNQEFSKASCYPFHILKKSMKYMGICGTAFKNGSNVPEDSQENKVFAHDVSFNEATSESVQQMSLNCIILREYGVPIEYFSKISQIGSLILSATSVILAFTKRHSYVSNNRVDGFTSNNFWKGVAYWFLPFVMYFSSVYVIAFSRESFAMMIIITIMMLHPIVTIPMEGLIEFIQHDVRLAVVTKLKHIISVSNQLLAQRIGDTFKYWSENHSKAKKILERLFTFSMITYLGCIMTCQTYLFVTWIKTRQTISNNGLESVILLNEFKDKDFNICCEDNCLEGKTNWLLNIMAEINQIDKAWILFGSSVFFFIFHWIQSLCLFLPAPIPMKNFLSGKPFQNPTNIEYEMPINYSFKRGKLILALIYITFIVLFPNAYPRLILQGISQQSPETWVCSTTNLSPCTFPFLYQNQSYHGCLRKNDSLPWCAIDANPLKSGSSDNFKSIGMCKDDCPGACSNGTQLYNIWGLKNCSKPFICKPGYGGQTCNECVNYHYPSSGKNGIVDKETGEGVKCIPCKDECRNRKMSDGCDENGKCMCKPGYYGFDECRSCNCHHFGSLDINCDKFGSCSCKAGFIGPKCNKCADDYFGADENCLPCYCDQIGSNNSSCTENGSCYCKPEYTGHKCTCQKSTGGPSFGERRKRSDDYGVEGVNCYLELVDKEILKYRVWCEYQKCHDSCFVQEICLNSFLTTFGYTQSDHVLRDDLATFEFDSNYNTFHESLRKCEMNITVTDSTKPLRLMINGLDSNYRHVWESTSIQIPREEDIEFNIKVSEECAIGIQCAKIKTGYGGDIFNSEANVKEVCEPIKDPEKAKEKAQRKCHELCNEYTNYPVYIWAKSGRCLFTKNATIPEEQDNGRWHYGLCADYVEPSIITDSDYVKTPNPIDSYRHEVVDDTKDAAGLILALIIPILTASIVLGFIALFLYKRRKPKPTQSSNEMIYKERNLLQENVSL